MSHPSGPPIPEKIELLSDFSGITIRRTWRGWTVVPLLFFVVVWDSFLVFWYTQAIGGHGWGSWLAILFPIGHVAVGMFLTYTAVATLLNKTDIRITADRVAVKTYPIPWRGTQVVAATEITGLRSKSTLRKNQQPKFEIRYRTQENREKKLVSGGLNEDEAEFIEYHLRKTLGISAE